MPRMLMPRLLPIMVLLLLLAVWVLQRPLTAGGGPAAQLEACQAWALVARRSSVVAQRVVCCRRDDGVGVSTELQCTREQMDGRALRVQSSLLEQPKTTADSSKRLLLAHAQQKRLAIRRFCTFCLVPAASGL